MYVDTLIVGAGPGGLSCATRLAAHGQDTLVLERKGEIGTKVCAGGITWGGMISRLPATLAEKSFPRQYIRTPLQQVCIEEDTPIIATVNRQKLGQHMAELALKAGARVRTNCSVRSISGNTVSVQDRINGNKEEISFTHLVGADGSSSLVRRFLGLKNSRRGVGINYQLPGDLAKMEWHLDNHLFGNGYAWIFPHSDTVSIGAYADQRTMTATKLKNSLISWASKQGFSLEKEKAKAETINYDFQGWNFGTTFLVGDAAGLASGLTGEGIYPAIISGEEVAETILNAAHPSAVMDKLIRKHKMHSRMVELSRTSRFLNTAMAELVTLALRSGMITFDKLEMAV